MTSDRNHLLARFLVFFLLASGSARAQTGSGVVKGTVRDVSGSVIPGAKVTLKNQDTNALREAQTSGDGIYYFAEIPPGAYALRVEHSGFQT